MLLDCGGESHDEVVELAARRVKLRKLTVAALAAQ
jgi:hypothetical protein